MEKDLKFSRNTKQRDAIIAVFRCEDRPLSPNEAFELSKIRVAGMGLTTIYRAIKSCLELGLLIEVTIPGETTRYEVAGKKPHHHFFCNDCEKLFEVDGCNCNVETKVPDGFLVKNHHVTLYGTCSNCNF